MLKELSSQVLPIIIQAIVTILGVVISTIGVIAVKYVQAKKTELINKIGKDKYNQEKAYALDIWNLVDEHFRISGISNVTIGEKVALFEKELLKKVPYLTQDELDSLRLSLGGVINKGKKAIVSDVEASQLAAQSGMSTSTNL